MRVAPWAFAFLCFVLALQLLLVWYSYSEGARSILWLDGHVRPDAAGVSESRWVLSHMTDPPVPSGTLHLRRGALGIHYVTTPGVYYAVIVHMAWTIAPTAVIVALGGKKRLENSWVRYRSGRRRDRGLCGVCAYDIREARQRCPECGTSVPLRVRG